MNYGKAFFDLQLRFARHVAAISGMPFEQALLDYTNLYIRFGLGRGFDPEHPAWRAYIDGLAAAPDTGDWTHRFFLLQPGRVVPPALVARSGCFSYGTPEPRLIRLHFEDVERGGCSPLAANRVDARKAELRLLFVEIARAQAEQKLESRPESELRSVKIVGNSWLYNLPAYRRLFPVSYMATAKVVERRFRHMPLWGQFLDRHGAVREQSASVFLARLRDTFTIAGLEACFPFQVLEVHAPVEDFYDFYDIQSPHQAAQV